MERIIAVAASIVVLVGTLSSANAGTTARSHRRPVQAARCVNSLDSAVPVSAAEPNAHRYHGGPKSSY